MKIVIDESDSYEDVEIIIKCRKCDEQILSFISCLKMQDQKIIGMLGEKSFVLEPSDILYFDSVDKKCFIYTAAEVYETGLKLYEIERILKVYGFVRASKSTIINMMKIKSIKPEFNATLSVEMENGEMLIVSRQYAPIMKERLIKQ